MEVNLVRKFPALVFIILNILLCGAVVNAKFMST